MADEKKTGKRLNALNDEELENVSGGANLETGDQNKLRSGICPKCNGSIEMHRSLQVFGYDSFMCKNCNGIYLHIYKGDTWKQGNKYDL